MHENEWAELGKIDYFLEHLARAVERGEVPRDAYDTLAPRYLERRAELATVLAGGPVAVEQEIEPLKPAVRVDAAVLPGGEPQRVSRPVRLSWTTALVITGAFLVIVAAAVFALAAWQLASPLVRVAFLGVLTLAFYAAGDRVRAKLDLSAGGAALTVVASAMLLFDGWIIIDGYGLTGPLPWAVWMLVCSAVYWYTEVRLAGGFFGVVGAAAQVAWWWLLADGLGWEPAPRLAVIAVVVAVWSAVSARVDEHSAVATLARVLRVVAPAASLVVVLAFVPGVVFLELHGVATLVYAAVVGWAFTAVVRVSSMPNTAAGFGHLPLVLVVFALVVDPTWSLVAVLGALAMAYAIYEAFFGGGAHGAVGLVTELGLVLSVGRLLDWTGGTQLLALALLAVSWMVASVMLSRVAERAERSSARPRTYAVVAEVGAWLLLAAVTVSLPGTIGPPLVVWDVTGYETVVSLAIGTIWLAAGVLLRRPGALGAAVVSLYALACLLDVLDIGWPASGTALPFLGVLGAWSVAAGLIERITDLDRSVTRLVMRVGVPVVLATALAVDAWSGRLPSWEGSLLLVTVAIWFVTDAIATGQLALLNVAAPAAVCAGAMLGGWREAGAGAAVVAAALALLVAAVGRVMRARRAPGDWSAWTAAATGLTASFFAYDDALPLALALALSAAASAFAAAAVLVPNGYAVAGLAGAGALWAMLAHLQPESWVTVVATGAYGFALLAPAWFGARGGKTAEEMARSLAVAGATAVLVPVLLGLEAGVLGVPATEWWACTGWAWPVALGVLGAYLLATAVTFRMEAVVYAGTGVLLLAYWAALAEGDVTWIEWYALAGGGFVTWCGYRWAAGAPGRRVPLLADIATAAIVLGAPSLALVDPSATDVVSWTHTFWAFGLGIVAIALGVVLRARAYFFGGIAALVWTSVVRSWTYLVEYWWVVLGVVGITMIAVALTREWRRAMLDGVRDALDGWR